MSTDYTTNRLAAALEHCNILEKEWRRREIAKEQELQEKKRQRDSIKVPKPQSSKARCDYVYLIKASNGYYKIGISCIPNKRFRELQRDASIWAITLELVHLIQTNKAYILEQSFHKRFAKQRVIGEWFLLTPLDVEWLQAL